MTKQKDFFKYPAKLAKSMLAALKADMAKIKPKKEIAPTKPKPKNTATLTRKTELDVDLVPKQVIEYIDEGFKRTIR